MVLKLENLRKLYRNSNLVSIAFSKYAIRGMLGLYSTYRASNNLDKNGNGLKDLLKMHGKGKI